MSAITREKLRYLNVRAHKCKARLLDRLSDDTISMILGATIAIVGILVSCLANAYVYGYLG